MTSEIVPCENCGANGLRMIEVRGVDVWARCNCAYGRMLSSRVNRPTPPRRAEQVLTDDEVSMAIEGLASIPWFPKEDGARTMIADAIARLCGDSRSSFELVRRMVDMYRQWPGVREMRICYCALVGPPLSGEDLHLAVSEFYPDGFGPALASVIPTRKQLPTGKAVEMLDDAAWRERIEKNLTSIDPQEKAYALPDPEEAQKTRREVLQERHQREMSQLKPITQADVDKAVEELRERQARAEKGNMSHDN
jgi:hypothetical protein